VPLSLMLTGPVPATLPRKVAPYAVVRL